MIAHMNRDLPTATAPLQTNGRLPRARLVLATADLDVQAAVRGLFGDAVHGGLAIASSTAEAIAALDKRRTDLLLLDLDLDHDEVLAGLSQLRGDSRWQFLPVIVLSGARDGSLRLAALERGATEILAKPLDPVELELRLRNMLALKAYQDRLRNLDPVTGLANRDEFLHRVDTLLAGDGDSPRTLVRLDLVRFRQVIDALGQNAGNQLLASVAQRLNAIFLAAGGQSRRADDAPQIPWLGRMNRDTFLAVLRGHSDEPAVAALLDTLIEALSQPFSLDDDEVVLSPAVGLALFPDHGRLAEELVDRAGLAVRSARQAAGKPLAIYTPEIGEEAQQRLTIEQELRRAIDRNELCVHYQPKHDVKTLAIVGAEALVRWNHPQRGLLGPSAFVALAEESGLVAAIGRSVLESGSRELVAWDEAQASAGNGSPPLRMAINLSALQFDLGNIVPMVALLLKDTGLTPSRLTLELTETLLIDEGDGALDQLRALKHLGVELSLDDFGTGYSSLAYLQRFPLDEIKIDRSFVRDLDSDERAAAIVAAIIALARELKLRVVAEGVETHAQLERLRLLGCDQFQGFLLGQPMAGEVLAARLRRGEPAPTTSAA